MKATDPPGSHVPAGRSLLPGLESPGPVPYDAAARATSFKNRP